MAEVEIPNPREIEEIRTKNFTRRVALTTAIYAVFLAITSLGGNHAMKGMLLAQQKASDQWSFYQSKVMREHLYKTQRYLLETQLAERRASMSPAARSSYKSHIKALKNEEIRYQEEKQDIEREAKKLEHERDIDIRRDPYLDYAEVLLQIAIVMASISILALSRPVYCISIITAVIGSVLSFNGYTLIFTLPFFR